MCSDGLTGEVSDSRIGELMTSQTSAQSLAELFVGAADPAFAQDNVTVLVLLHAPGSGTVHG